MQRLSPSQETRRVIEEIFHPPAWAEGNVVADDAAFLYEMVIREQPARVVEIGVASGASTSVLAAAMAESRRRQGKHPHATNLLGFDIGKQCYFDATRRVGSAIREMVPELADNVILCLGEGASRVKHYCAPGSLTFVFIDGDHRHPHATLDVLALLPVLAPRVWVLLHDISLPDITDDPECQIYGPKHLFDQWPGEKLAAENYQEPQNPPNIGAIRMPDDPWTSRGYLIKLLELPWECDLPDDYLNEMGLSQEDLTHANRHPGGEE